MNLAPDSASVILPSQLCHVQEVPPNFSAVTRINSPVLPARHLQLVNHELAPRDASDQDQECASEEADSNLTTTLNFFSFKSLIFPVLLRMQLSTEPPSSEGAMDGVQRRSRLHDNRKDNYGRNCNPHFMFRRGNVSGSASMCEGPHAGDPRRARYQRRRGNGRTPRRRHVKLPRLARPKGCFEASDVWS